MKSRWLISIFTGVIVVITVILYIFNHRIKRFRGQRPNILFCLGDDISFPHMGSFGCSWVSTPAFDRVASEGVLFMNAYTPNAKSAPSRASILTGRNSWQLEEAANHFCYFPQNYKTYAEVLDENGYFVGSTGKTWAPGDPGTINGKRRELTGPEWSDLKLKPSTTGISNIDYAGNFRKFLDDKPENEPFCFWFGSLEPHRSFEYGSSLRLAGMSTEMIDTVPGFWPDNEIVRTDMLDYSYEISHFDEHLSRMLEILEKKGMLENTIVVVTADNGMAFPRAKGQVYEYSNHLPLAIMWKNGIRKPGRKVSDYVSFIDFAPTFLEVAGIKDTEAGMQKITGRSLTDLLYVTGGKRASRERESVLIGKERHDIGRPDDQGYPIRGVVRNGYLYLRNFKTDRWPAGNPETGYLNVDGSPTKTEVLKTLRIDSMRRCWELSFGKRGEEELYNVSLDPFCLNNLADSAGYEELKNDCSAELMRRLRDEGDPRVLGQGDIFDEFLYSGKERDFYNRRMNGDTLIPSWVNRDDFNYVPDEEQYSGINIIKKDK
ncbi:MAG: sulfatase [Bacteroidales bacterium]|nr:sulfatase [Bacteroidales bacterium]